MKYLFKKVKREKGAALILAIIFMSMFSALALAMTQMSTMNVQVAQNHKVANRALSAAQSGLECAQYLAINTNLPETHYNFVTENEADQVWSDFCTAVQSTSLGNDATVNSFNDSTGSGNEIVTEFQSYGSDQEFQLRFYRYDGQPHTINIQSIGKSDNTSRDIYMQMEITKNADVLNYAVAGRGRMWLVGDSHIHGNIYSTWDREEISPFKVDENSTVEGSINTCLTLDQIQSENYQLETLDANDEPMYDEDGNKIISSDDEIQGEHEEINYDVQHDNMPGLDISDYDTDCYNDGLYNIPASSDIEVEYFPHAAGNYNYPRDGTPSYTYNLKLYRHVYENEHFVDVRLPDDRNALFRNCVFDGVLYIDCYKSGYYHYNNVRFENCTFQGVIITDTPERLKWQ